MATTARQYPLRSTSEQTQRLNESVLFSAPIILQQVVLQEKNSPPTQTDYFLTKLPIWAFTRLAKSASIYEVAMDINIIDTIEIAVVKVVAIGRNPRTAVTKPRARPPATPLATIASTSAARGVQSPVSTPVIVIGIGQSFIDQYFSIIKDDVPDLNSLIVLLLASIILLVLTNKLPLLLSGVVGGASLQGIGGFGAGMITGAAATAISGAGAMAMGASAQVSGGASALKAAFESAQAAMAEESGSGGVIGGGEDTGSVDTSGEQPSGKGRSSGGSEGFAASFSRAGRMASHMGSSMANGAAEYQTLKRSSNSSRVQQTIGGELATQIRKQTATRRDNREHDDFAGDSLSGNNKS
jgi:hypothetical protein